MRKFFSRIMMVLMSAALCCGGVEAQVKADVAECDRVDLPGVHFRDMATDTLEITRLLDKGLRARGLSAGQVAALLGREFLGRPYVAHTLEGGTELLRVNLEELDCTTFIETVAALARTVDERCGSWHDFLRHLESLRYRGGEMDGYVSRLHYVADWVSNNTYRGNVTDAATLFPDTDYMVKTIDFMSSHRGSYPALKDSAVFEGIRHVENGLVNHRFPYIKANRLGRRDVQASFREGDFVAFVCNIRGLDVSHWGMVVFGDDGLPHVLHASQSAGRVVLSDAPLSEFVKRNRYAGVRVIRLR